MASSHASVSRTLAAVLLLAAVATPHADGHATRRDADQLKQKVAAIQSHAERGSKQPRRTTVTEIELNSYLALDAREQLPAGVVEPSITIVGTGRVSGRAVVDLDAVRKQKAPTSLLDPMNYLTGRLPVTATGVLTTSNGVGHFELESASISSLPIPKLFLQEIVSYYSRTADKPAGVSLDDPFALPSRIREIQVLRGQAIIVQ
jgi:hypothetical protein